jgi:hypothetical protein
MTFHASERHHHGRRAARRAHAFALVASVSVAEPDTPGWDENQASAGARPTPASLLRSRGMQEPTRRLSS